MATKARPPKRFKQVMSNPIDGNTCGVALYQAVRHLEKQGQGAADILVGLMIAALNHERHSGMVEGEVERAVAMLRTMPTRQMPIDRDGHPIVAKGQA